MPPATRIPGSITVLTAYMPRVEVILLVTRAGFRISRGCRDSVCIFAWTVEWLLENNLPAFITYIDFKAAFDSLSHDYLSYSLRKFPVPEKTIRVVKVMYDRATVALRLQLLKGERLHSNRVSDNRRVLQGAVSVHCISSPHFPAYSANTICLTQA